MGQAAAKGFLGKHAGFQKPGPLLVCSTSWSSSRDGAAEEKQDVLAKAMEVYAEERSS